MATKTNDRLLNKMTSKDFMPFHLYVWRGDKGSESALELCKGHTQVFVQDVGHLKKHEIPKFLKGVPTLADVKRKDAFQGTACLNKLKELCATELRPAPLMNGFQYSTGDFHSRSFVDGGAVSSMQDIVAGDGLDATIMSGRDKIGDETVSNYMALRSKVADAAVKKAQAKSGSKIPAGSNRVPPSVGAAHLKAVESKES